MAQIGDSFLPGEEVPDSGLYVCDTDDGKYWSVQLRGGRFPPLPSECNSSVWVLSYKSEVYAGSS
jgi:hypothetical protein